MLLETNVDDLDPRLWPAVIAALLDAGASDAWLTPILMKKGRPAHTLSVLVPADRADAVRREIYRQTSTIGLREQPVGKHELDREMAAVEVARPHGSRSRWPGSTERCSTCSRSSRTSPRPRARWAVRSRR